jgi:hypothetical protein
VGLAPRNTRSSRLLRRRGSESHTCLGRAVLPGRHDCSGIGKPILCGQFSRFATFDRRGENRPIFISGLISGHARTNDVEYEHFRIHI